jgi:L-ascorbate metabolism protein UlaG (beta-lactamase superfamily)
MKITRLNWAGLHISDGVTSIAIDPFYNVNTDFFGKSHVPFISLRDYGKVDAIFVTHLHTDHFDPKEIVQTYGVDTPVYVPAESLNEAMRSELQKITGVQLGQQVSIGSIEVTASFSVDGLGDPQCSWVIRTSNNTVIHCGDTLWHGCWWKMARDFGPFDIAFLPINGALVKDPDLIPSGEPICMTPEQAVSAAIVLGAKKIVPIHFAAFHNPPIYNETAECINRFVKAANARGVNFSIYQPGESFML